MQIIFNKKFLQNRNTREPTETATEPEVATETIKATKATSGKTKRKISSLKLSEEILNKLKNEQKNTIEQIFQDCSFLSVSFIFSKKFI